jgi:hypothetical protein
LSRSGNERGDMGDWKDWGPQPLHFPHPAKNRRDTPIPCKRMEQDQRVPFIKESAWDQGITKPHRQWDMGHPRSLTGKFSRMGDFCGTNECCDQALRNRAQDRLPRKDLREPQGAPQIPPLRYAPVGMTRGERWLRLEFASGWRDLGLFSGAQV